jgi:hypothetical protein
MDLQILDLAINKVEIITNVHLLINKFAKQGF